MDDLPDTLARLTASLESLERRVYALEHPSQAVPPIAKSSVSASATAQPASADVSSQDGVFSVVGKAMLGIAGAYLLRAIAESAALPQAVIVAIAIAYAVAWLVAATRVQPEAWFASLTYAATSVLILLPMLWELTLRFRALSTPVTACVLGAFVAMAFSLAWKRHFAAVVWVAAIAGSMAALSLSIATRDLVPFILAVLAMAAMCEYAAAYNRSLGVRWLVAAAADIAVWTLIYIGSRPGNIHDGYQAVSGAFLLATGPILLLLYGVSATVQTMLERRRITFFETMQTLIAFLLAAWGVLSFWSGTGTVVLGGLCLFFAAAGYAVIFIWFGEQHAQRNYHVYAAGSAALLLSGAYLSLPPMWSALCLSLAAIAATIVGVRTNRLALMFYGLAFLATAAFLSGLLQFIFRAIAGSYPSSPAWLVWCVSAIAVLCYAVERRFQAELWKHRLLYVLSAALAVGATTALLIWALVRLLAIGTAPGVSHIAVIRTLIDCAIALALAYSGSRWQRSELGWLAYAALAFVASKLLFEDLRHGHLGFTAISIFLYAITLLLVPRLVRLAQKARRAL